MHKQQPPPTISATHHHHTVVIGSSSSSSAATTSAATAPTKATNGFSMPPLPASIAAVMSTRVERIKVVAAVHFVCISFALLGTFLPAAYAFYNLVFLLALLWSVHCKESIDAIHTALVVDAAAILLDLICIIGWFTSYNNFVSIIFAIVNLAVRPFSLIVLQRELTDRGGSLSFGTVYPAGGADGRQPTAYEDIDRLPTQSIPSNMA